MNQQQTTNLEAEFPERDISAVLAKATAHYNGREPSVTVLRRWLATETDPTTLRRSVASGLAAEQAEHVVDQVLGFEAQQGLRITVFTFAEAEWLLHSLQRTRQLFHNNTTFCGRLTTEHERDAEIGRLKAFIAKRWPDEQVTDFILTRDYAAEWLAYLIDVQMRLKHTRYPLANAIVEFLNADSRSRTTPVSATV